MALKVSMMLGDRKQASASKIGAFCDQIENRTRQAKVKASEPEQAVRSLPRAHLMISNPKRLPLCGFREVSTTYLYEYELVYRFNRFQMAKPTATVSVEHHRQSRESCFSSQLN